MKKKIVIILSLIGLIISTYLYFEGRKINCYLNGCSEVLSSSYSKIFGIENSLLGIFYFFLSGLLTIFNKENILRVISIFSFLFALYLVFIMFFILKKICYNCLIVDISVIIIFILIHNFPKYLSKIFRS